MIELLIFYNYMSKILVFVDIRGLNQQKAKLMLVFCFLFFFKFQGLESWRNQTSAVGEEQQRWSAASATVSTSTTILFSETSGTRGQSETVCLCVSMFNVQSEAEVSVTIYSQNWEQLPPHAALRSNKV